MGEHIGEAFQPARPPKGEQKSPFDVTVPISSTAVRRGFPSTGSDDATVLRRLEKPVGEMLADAEESLAAAREKQRKAAREVRNLERMITARPSLPADPTPGTMPRFRNYLARHCSHLDDPDGARRAINVAELYWIAPQMVDVAEAAARTLPDYDAAWGARPSDYGLVWLGRRLVRESFTREGVQKSDDVGCVAVRWQPHGDGFQVHGYVHCLDLSEHLADRAIRRPGTRDEVINFELHGFLGPGGPGAWITNDDPITVRRGDPVDPAQPLAAFLASAWLLMGQTMIVDASPADIEPKIRREERRAGRPDPTVTVIELRRAKGEPSGDPSGREYHHRWMVSGHWRNQPYGPGRSQHRPVWINPYVKGPEDAPLLVTEKVRVWRR